MKQELIDLLSNFGNWAIILSLIINVMINVIGVIPSLFITGTNVMLWGPWWGGLLSWMSEIIGSGVAFLLYRAGLQHYKDGSARQMTWVQSLNQMSRKEQRVALLMARFTPVIPSGIVNVLGAWTTIMWSDFIITTAIGKIPSIIIEVFVIFGFTQIKNMIWIGSIIFIIIGGFYIWKTHQRRIKTRYIKESTD